MLAAATFFFDVDRELYKKISIATENERIIVETMYYNDLGIISKETAAIALTAEVEFRTNSNGLTIKCGRTTTRF